MKTKSMLPVILIVLFMTTLALAGNYHQGYGNHHGCGYGIDNFAMDQIDGDKDGGLTFEEFGKKQMERVRSTFDAIDANKDGEVDEMEWTELMRMHGLADDPAP